MHLGPGETHLMDEEVTEEDLRSQFGAFGDITSLALMTAKAEMSLGRADIHTIIVVFTDGRPLSYRKTTLASVSVRKASRLLWVPVTKYAPLKWVKLWATRRWQENVVQVRTFADLEKPEIGRAHV